MTLKQPFFFLLFMMCQCICAQQDSIIRLDEVLISDVQLKKFSNSQSVQQLPDSVIRKNAASLTSLLQYNSVIYFKENGLGMVSSPSFRGTTAQQTAVIWNGININSQLNGLTDFNTISAKDFNSGSVRAGGGSSIYGSSAIGGSIHLNNDLYFGRRFENALQTSYGSFNTLNASYKIQAGSERFASQISVSRNSSENDYPYLDTNLKNENGRFYNTSFNVNAGYKIDSKNVLKLYSYLYEGERHFSGTLAAPSKSKYNDLNTRNLLEWTGSYSKFTSRLKAAFLSETYRYFENAATSIVDQAEVKTVVARYDLSYKATSKLETNIIAEYTENHGTGDDIGRNTRKIGSGVLLLKHAPFKQFLYEISVRKELTDSYKSPVLYSIGTTYSPLRFYKLKLNGSKNFRIPTFNDLYWQGSGNANLKPESSYQVEMGNAFQFKNTSFSVTGYYIKIEDLLRWSPGANGNWSPNNIADVTTYGAEVLFSHIQKIGKSQFDFNATYAYTVSEDKERKKQLIYVPYHKATASLGYSIAKFSAYFQSLFNGEVYTSSDNFYSLKEYFVSNVGVDYSFGKKKNVQLGSSVLNVFNEKYQSVSKRPMPGRNYIMHLTFKF